MKIERLPLEPRDIQVLFPVSDREIAAGVRAAIQREPGTCDLEVQVAAFAGGVELNGFVNERWQARRVVELATGVPGVAYVVNNLGFK